MRLATRSSLAAAMLIACGNHAGPEQIDGQYRVKITQLLNTCDGLPVGDGAATARLDLYPRSDGRFDFRWIDGWVPEEFAFEGIAVEEGVASTVPGGAEEISGMITAESVDVTLTRHGERFVDGSPCSRVLRVSGGSRRMFSLDSVDGRYIVRVENRGFSCPDGRADQGGGAWMMRMEVAPFRPDRASVTVYDTRNGMFHFWTEPFASDGVIRFVPEAFFTASASGLTGLTGTVEGAITPFTADFETEFRAADDADGCAYRYGFIGGRWMPDGKTLTNEYKASYRLADSCDGYEAAYEAPVFTVLQAEGEIDLIDAEIQRTVDYADGRVSARFGGGPSGPPALTYEGTVSPLEISYAVEKRYVSAGRDCVLRMEVSGNARYLGL